MKGFLKMFRTAFVFCAVMMLLCSFAYPLALTGASQAVMKEKAGGSLIDREGNLTDDPEKAVGSVLLGQDFTEDYFLEEFPLFTIIHIQRSRKRAESTAAFPQVPLTTETPTRIWRPG